ncbi:MAG: UbiD family decarboxylase, partial [Anaerolineales bacterium]|nr:UbiD family decarboxylase [Anaerolineales bacterium]
AAVRLLFPAMKMTLPEIIDINMPAEGTFHNLVIVSIKKEYPGHARKVMHAIWGLGLLSLTKCIIIVDHFVDVQNLSEVAWRVTNNLNPASDVVFTDGPIDDLDHSSPTAHYGSKMGIDATAKLREVGRSREWPPDIVMSDSIREIVDEKWSKFGI